MAYTLVIGTKTYSSWSLRPWIAMVEAGIPFREEVVALYQPDTKARIAAHSPTSTVPVLVDGDIRIPETIAILEYLAERHPEAALWPEGRAARAHARAIAAEMHAGFSALRRALPMNVRRTPPRPPAAGFAPEVLADVARIAALWTDTRTRFGAGGPFLFGRRFGAADAMFAPVAHRLEAYAADIPPPALAYRDAVLATAGWRRWREEAAAEPNEWVNPSYGTI